MTGSTLNIDDVMRTAFTARSFTDADVTVDQVAEVLDAARFAPSGGNRQGWRVVVVRDAATKTELFRLGSPAVRVYLAQIAAGENPWTTVAPTAIDVDAAGGDESIDVSWWEGLAAAPVVLAIGVDLSLVASVDSGLDRVGVNSGASIYPFVQNILLAARARGLGTALTTFVASAEDEARALLHLPPEIALAAVMPLGWPTRELTKLSRHPVETFARLERWDGQPLGADGGGDR